MAYAHVRALTFDPTQVGGSDHADLTVTLDGVFPDLAGVGSGGEVQSADGNDIAYFLSFDGVTPSNPTDHFQKVYVSATGQVTHRIKVPSYSHSVAPVIYQAYGDASISTFQGNVSGSAWDANTKMVQEFRDGVTLDVSDVSGHGNDLTNSGGVTAGSPSTGGKAVFDGASSLTRTTPVTVSPTSAWTIAIRGKLDEVASLTNLLDFEDGINLGAIIYWWSSGNGMLLQRGTQNDTTYATELASAVDLSVEHDWVFVWDGVSARAQIYVDGVDLSAPGSAGLSKNSANITGLAYGFGGGFQSRQTISRYRMANVGWSADRVLADYNAHNSPTIVSRGSDLLAAAAPSTGTTVYLYPVAASDTDVVLRNPLVALNVYTHVASGGLSAGGSASVARTVAAPAATGGLQSTGAASIARTRAVAASGGMSGSGAASVARSFGVTPSGGFSSSGAATIARTRAMTSVGGLLAAGIAAIAVTVTPSSTGGLSASGHAAVANVAAIAPAGGLASGGGASLQYARTFTHVAAGGLSSSGAATIARVRSVAGAGGLSASGTANVVSSATLLASGGLSSSGSASIARTRVALGVGGLSSSGAAGLARTFAAAASGGLNASGAATTSFEPAEGPTTYEYVATGGATSGGAAGISRTLSVVGASGLSGSGAAIVARARAVIASGGISSSGSASVARTRTATAVGGLIAGGAAIVARTQSAAGSGGLTASGAAAGARTFAVVALGGGTFGGSADVRFIPYNAAIAGPEPTSVSLVQPVATIPFTPVVATLAMIQPVSTTLMTQSVAMASLTQPVADATLTTVVATVELE